MLTILGQDPAQGLLQADLLGLQAIEPGQVLQGLEPGLDAVERKLFSGHRRTYVKIDMIAPD